MEVRILLTTCTPGEADALVLALLRERLIGCGNAVPGVRSHYWWEGELCSDEEVLIVMETSAALVVDAAARLRALHSYDVPKIITLDPEGCDEDYRRWLLSVTSDA